MNVIRTYEIRKNRIVCRLYPALQQEEDLLSPSVVPIVMSYALDLGSRTKNRLFVQAPPVFSDADLIQEISLFLTTLKTMYQL